MSYRYPADQLTPDPIEDHINQTIDHILSLLYIRRAQLLLQAHNTREDLRAREASRQKSITELKGALATLENLRLNTLQFIGEDINKEIKSKRHKLQREIPPETRSEWRCDLQELEGCIGRLGEISVLMVGLPSYESCRVPVVATAKKGRAPGELDGPYGVAIHEDTNRIYVADHVNGRIEVFSEKGEHLSQLGGRELHGPYGIAIHGDNAYVTCWNHTISKLSLTDMSFVRTKGEYGSADGQFDYPTQLAIDPTGLIFIADSCNNRICVYDVDLFHQRSINMEKPLDVKIARGQLYVLCHYSNPCMHVLTLNGVMECSLVTCGAGMVVKGPVFFCLDSLNNFVISDQESHSIRVFSPEGNLLHTIGREGHEPGSFSRPQGVAVTPNGNLVCVSNNINYGLQIFH